MRQCCVAYELSIDNLVDMGRYYLKYKLCHNQNEHNLDKLRNKQNNFK